MEETVRALIERLALRGMPLSSIPSYIRNLANSVSADPYMTLNELNGIMESLGWNDFTLDDHTLHLIITLLAEHTDMEPGHPMWQRATTETRISTGPDAREDASA